MKILVTLDGSDFARAALTPASEVATAAGGEVHLLSVLNEYETEREGKVVEKLLAAEAATLSPLKVETKLLTSDRVAEAITSYAREESFDFIAMATHGRTGVAKTIMGSVAAELQRISDIPLLLVRPKELK